MDVSRSTFFRGLAATAAPLLAPATASAECAPTPPDNLPNNPSPEEWDTLPRPRALVLAGGVALGCYQAGVLSALNARGYEFDLICGTSIGAINGAMAAQGKYDALITIWRTIASKDITAIKPVFQPIAHPFARRYEPDAGLFNRTRAGVYTYAMLGAIASFVNGGAKQIAVCERGPSDDIVQQNVRLEDVKTPFAYVGTNLNLERPEAFYVVTSKEHQYNSYEYFAKNSRAHTDMPLHEISVTNETQRDLFWQSVRASGAFPLAFDPIELMVSENGRPAKPYYFCDGGITANTPLSLAFELGARTLLTVYVNPRKAPSEKDTKTFTLPSLADSIVGTLSTRQITKDIFLIEQICPSAVFYEIRPLDDLPVGTFSFDDNAAVNCSVDIGLKEGAAGPVGAGSRFRTGE
ncbi:MAG TPA: patatin-like phospholipase family protein [Verrucomicrobiae bacterium]|nr:patatin-like phospholipase family protein [Verrucomicrobiae bacterium]